MLLFASYVTALNFHVIPLLCDLVFFKCNFHTVPHSHYCTCTALHTLSSIALTARAADSHEPQANKSYKYSCNDAVAAVDGGKNSSLHADPKTCPNGVSTTDPNSQTKPSGSCSSPNSSVGSPNASSPLPSADIKDQKQQRGEHAAVGRADIAKTITLDSGQYKCIND